MGSEIFLQRASLLLAILALAIALALLGWRIYDQVLESHHVIILKMLILTKMFLVTWHMG